MHIDRTVFCWETAAGHLICYFTYVYFHSCTYTLTHAKKLYIFYPSCQSRPAVGEHFHPWRHFSPHLVSAFQTAGESRVPFKPLERLFTLQSIVMRVGSSGECHVCVIRHPAGSLWVGSVVQLEWKNQKMVTESGMVIPPNTTNIHPSNHPHLGSLEELEPILDWPHTLVTVWPQRNVDWQQYL